MIFLSALNAIEHKVKGFRSGGVDFISKPFQFEEVQARVETHLKLRRAQRAERDLLEKTLGGAVGTLWELVQLTLPVLALRSGRDSGYRVVDHQADGDSGSPGSTNLPPRLCLVGCIALPDEVFERAYCGQVSPPDEDRMFRAHPESALRLLANIPRLEVVAEIIRGQQITEEDAAFLEESRQGAQIASFSTWSWTAESTGESSATALAELRMSGRSTAACWRRLKATPQPRRISKCAGLPIRDAAARHGSRQRCFQQGWEPADLQGREPSSQKPGLNAWRILRKPEARRNSWTCAFPDSPAWACWRSSVVASQPESENLATATKASAAVTHSDIMIVDDNPANLKLLEDMLTQQGHEVRSFPLGRLALAAAMRDSAGFDSAGHQHAGDERLRSVRTPQIHRGARRTSRSFFLAP